MKNHNELKELLSLAAAGALGEDEAVEVSRHVGQCAVCKEALEQWETLARACTALPAVAVPVWLSQKTLIRVRQRRQMAEEHRRENFVFAGLAAFSWIMSVVSCYVIHLTAGLRFLPLLFFFILFSWIMGVFVAMIFRAHLISSGRIYEPNS
jgi:anti-sigma factor RsiW